MLKWAVWAFVGLLVFPALLWAQNSFPQGPGFPNVPQVKGALLSGPLAPNQGRTASIAYHQGFIITTPESPGSAPGSDQLSRAWDISDPSNPTHTIIQGMGPNAGIAAHGYWQEGELLRALPGGDYSVIDSNQDGRGEFSQVPQPLNRPWYYPRHQTENIPWVSRGLLFQPFQTQMWWSYGATNYRGVLYKRNQVLAIWDHIAQTGVIGHPFLLGNILYVASDQSNTGIAAYDITPSLQTPGTPPRLLSVLRAPVGGYWPEIWGGAGRLLILFPSRENGHFFVADITDPLNMQVVADRQLPSGGDPSYAQFQDNFAFMDRYKIDMENNFAVDLTLDAEGQGIDVSQFALPVGNLLLTGGYPHPNLSQGMAIWAHQAEPDTKPPSVGYHIPASGQANYPIAAPISLIIHETLRSETIINGDTFVVRSISAQGIPGAPLSGRIIVAFDDILTFAPDQDFQPNTTYEVSLRQGGIQDAAGNGIQTYSFRFSTGSSFAIGNRAPEIQSFSASPYPVSPGAVVQLQASALDADADSLQYRFTFGDGSPESAWQSESQIAHTYAAAGHYSASVLVRDTSGSTSFRRLTVTVAVPPGNPRPTASSSIGVDSSRQLTWVVNQDNDSISRRVGSGEFREITLGRNCNPRGVGLDSNGRAWVTCHGTDEIVILNTDGSQQQRRQLAYGSAPMGIVPTPSGNQMLLTLYGRGEILRYDVTSFEERGRLALGPTPRAIAVSGDGGTAFITRFISPDHQGEIWQVSLGGSLSLVRTIALPIDLITTDTAGSGRGLPNYLTAIAIHPRGDRAWVSSKLDNVTRGLFVSGNDLNQENSVRAIISEIDLGTMRELREARRDIDNSDSPSSILFSPLGDYAFIALQGNNVVAVYDVSRDASQEVAFVPVVGRFASERAPQSLALGASGEELLVLNYLSRSVSILGVSEFFRGTSLNVSTTHLSTQSTEQLSSAVLRGKRIFYNASDDGGLFGRNRMSADGYISCASCHLDGGHDGRIWDFTGRGEGLRNTTDLRGRRGTNHGRVHWSGNFDEIQDFENDIRNAFGGAGFMSDDDFARTVDPLAQPKSGLSTELDDLAAYVSSLGRESLPRSPFRNSDGSLSDQALRGQNVFASLGCQECHSGSRMTESGFTNASLRDVGTISSSSGFRRGLNLPGIDTPTLFGLWNGSPYFHDGSAPTLESVFSTIGGRYYQAETASLIGSAGAVGPQYGGVYHEGRIVAFGSGSAGIRWSSVDGADGGASTIRLRYSALYSAQNATLVVNGTSIPLALPRTENNPSWWPSGFASRDVSVTLQPGQNNVVEFIPTTSFNQNNMAVDEMVVFKRGFPDLTLPHANASNLGAGEFNDLIRYLRELDGNSIIEEETPTPTFTPTPNPTATATPTTIPTVTPTPIVTPTLPTPTESPTPLITPGPTPNLGFEVLAPSQISVQLRGGRGIAQAVIRVRNISIGGRNVRFRVNFRGISRGTRTSFLLSRGRMRRQRIQGRIRTRGIQQAVLAVTGRTGTIYRPIRLIVR